MKRLISILVLVIASLSMCAMKVNGIYYNILSSDNDVEVTYKSMDYYGAIYNDYKGDIIIPDSFKYNGEIYRVVKIGTKAFCSSYFLKSVTIPNSVTFIGGEAFNFCRELSSVTIGKGVSTIAQNAFINCNSLASVHITDLEAWCKITFNYNSNPLLFAHHLYLNGKEIKELTIPNNVHSIGKYTFSGCSGLTSVTIGNDVKSIGEYAFSGCSGLTSVTIGNGVKSIGKYVFKKCNSLISLTIEEGVEILSEGAFQNCTSLPSLTLPNSVTSIDAYAFGGCSGLKSLTIPNSVKEIGSYAFQNCTGITSLTIGKSVESIKKSSFANCPIKSITFLCPKVSEWFDNRNSIEEVIFGDGVESIGGFAFYGCSGLTSVNFSESVKLISQEAFAECFALTSLTIGDGVKTIGKEAFRGCIKLKTLTFGKKVSTIERAAFSCCYSLTSLTIPNSVTTIVEWAFTGCDSLMSVTIGDNVKAIGANAFFDCKKLSSVTIGKSVETIGKNAFGCCPLKSLTLLCTKVKNWFKDYSTINEILFADGVKTIENKAFWNNNLKNLKKVTIGNTVETIGEWAFMHCSSLTTVTIGNNVKTIGSRAFEDCSCLESITLGKKVSIIYEDAFKRCRKLLSVTSLNATPPTSNQPSTFPFQETRGAATLYVPLGCIDKYRHAFGWKEFKNIIEIDVPSDSSESDAPYSLEGDINGDGIVDSADIEEIEGYIMGNPSSYFNVTDADVNEDGVINVADIVSIIGNSGNNDMSDKWVMITDDFDKTIPFTKIRVLNKKAVKDAYRCVAFSTSPNKNVGVDSFFINFGTQTIGDNKPISESYGKPISSCTPVGDNWYEYEFSCPVYFAYYQDNCPRGQVKALIQSSFDAEYELTYMIDGEVYKNYKLKAGELINPENEPTKDGYSFSGWSEIPSTMPAHDVIVYGFFTDGGTTDSDDEDGNDSDNSCKYLTFVALESGTFKFSGNSVSFSLDNGSTWTTLTSDTNSPTVQSGNKIMWKGNLTPNYGIGRFSSTGRFNVEGNAMSLLFGDDFIGKTSLNGKNFAFYSLFNGCTTLTSISNLNLPATTLADNCYGAMFWGCTSLASIPGGLLPATALASECYQQMFKNCASLTTVPKLPATTLASECYRDMFSYCTSLTTVPSDLLPATTLADRSYQNMFWSCTSLATAPQLPATTLADMCYNAMFYECTSLTTAPQLPATTLANSCYRGMFSNCTSLTTAPELPATTLAEGCYGGMFYNCESLTTAPELPATTLANSCYRGMFSECSSLREAPQLPAKTLASYCYNEMFRYCTSLTTAPELPASTLAEGCYGGMFIYCSRLNYIKCLATNIYANNCAYNWVNGVSSSGTFVKASSMSSWSRGDSGIPANWTVQDDTTNGISSKWVMITDDFDKTIPFKKIRVLNKKAQIGSYCCIAFSTSPNENVGADRYYVSFGVLAIGDNMIHDLVHGFDISSCTPVGDNWYEYEFSCPVYFAYYQDNCPRGQVKALIQDSNNAESSKYLTFVAIDDGKFKLSGNSVQYSLDEGSTWTTLGSDTYSPTLSAGQKIMWKGNLTPNSNIGIGTFSSTGKFNVEGNIMSLLYGDDFKDKTNLSGKDYVFDGLFSGCTRLTSAENLVLPAMTLANYCYRSMFQSCTSLKKAPKLPAKTMSDWCYGLMFEGCTSLTIAPSLPANKLGESCYSFMFNGCTSLTTAPSLPCTNLAWSCYYYMFSGCTSLKTAPDLPATTLVRNCYQGMFSGCTSLYYIKCLATSISAQNCTEGWVKGVASSGRFVEASSMTSWTTGNDGIPSGWSIFIEKIILRTV